MSVAVPLEAKSGEATRHTYLLGSFAVYRALLRYIGLFRSIWEKWGPVAVPLEAK